jgi:hypothetical protein
MARRCKWVYDDGGRRSAGYKGTANDCVVRAIAIATERPYQEVYDAINEHAQLERPRKGSRRSSAREGVYRRTYERYLASLGWTFTPTMSIGSGCKVHLRADELPKGRIVCTVSKHVVAVVDGVIHDTDDPSRAGTRCVYGYYQPASPEGGATTKPNTNNKDKSDGQSK